MSAEPNRAAGRLIVEMLDAFKRPSTGTESNSVDIA
jgi:hypothetical protein